MTLEKLIPEAHKMVAVSFPSYKIRNYSFNETPVDENDFHKCIVEVSKISEDTKSQESTFVLFDYEKESIEVLMIKKYTNTTHQCLVKMHLFETAQKIIVAEFGKNLFYIDFAENDTGSQVLFGGSASVSGVMIKSFKKIIFRENTWGEIVKSNLPEYIGLLTDDNSFVIINIKTWKIVEMIKDILPMLEIEKFSIYQKSSQSKKIFVVLQVRGEFPDYQRSRVSVWDINLDPEGNYGMFRGTYVVEGFISQSAYYLEKRFVVEVKAYERTNFLNFK